MNKKTLKDFKSSLRSHKIFVDAVGQLPSFFNQNLVDQARSIKVFKNDDLAYMKIFYFQFLKLCFQTEDIDYTTKIDNFIDIVEKNLDLLTLPPRHSHSTLSSSVLKNLLFQFLQLISQCKQPVLTSLSSFPLIGDILTHFFSSYLKKFHPTLPVSSYNSLQSIKILSQTFLVQILDYQNCIQYTDSQVYVYNANPAKKQPIKKSRLPQFEQLCSQQQQKEDNLIYMIFIDQEKVERNQKIGMGGLEERGSSKSVEENGEVIVFMGGDVVFEDKGNKGDRQNQIGTKDCGDFAKYKGRKESQIKIFLEDAQTKATFSKTPTTSFYATIPQIDQSQKQNLPQAQSQPLKSQLPTQLQRLLSTPYSSPSPYPCDLDPSSSNLPVSNISKQFTNTFILDNMVIEPYRTKIKQLKNKARSQRKSKKPFLF